MGKNDDILDKSINWGEWSANGFPYDMEEEIKQINLDRGLDIWDSYGFRIKYYMYMEDMTREEIEEYFKTDDGYRIFVT